ncbi:hypothetical protein Ndes2437B_g02265 [Nannochloris sp. 'desiccata']
MAEINALVAGDASAFEGLLQLLMSAQNEERSRAENIFSELKKHADPCAQHLIRSLRTSPNLECRSLCAVLLRKVITTDSKSLWPNLSNPAKDAIKSELLNAIKEEQTRSLSHKICDCIGELGAGIIEENGWPELLPFMLQCVQSGDPRIMECALLIFEQLARYVMNVLQQYLGTLHTSLTACLAHNTMEVKLAAFKATATFIQMLENPVDRDQFQSMVPLMLSVIGAALNSGDEVAAQEAVEQLIEVADEHPRFLRRQLPEVVNAMLQIAETDSLDEGTRRLAAEFLVTLCEAREKAPGMMRKLPNFVQRLFNCCLTFLFDIEDDPQWHTAEDEKLENEGEGELFDFGQECLDRVSLALGGKTLVPIAGAALSALMADADWKKRHAALICIAQIAEGCVKLMSQEAVMGQLVALCLTGAADTHPKVRWAACQAVGQLCNDLGPELQETQHAAVLPALMALMDDFQNPRVQAHACAATVNFAENCDQDVVAPYLDTLIGKLLALLQQGRKNVQEGALTSLASVADCAQDYFVRYYDTCMPLLRHVLEHAQDSTQRLMRAKALECISLVGMAVGKERFGSDAGAVMQYIQAVTAQGLESDDPFASYMVQAGARICTTLGPDFIPYLPIVMPEMLQAAQLEPDVVVNESDDEAEESGADGDGGEDDGDMETYLINGKRVSLHTSLLEEKASACTMLCCYAYELKEGFFPYAEQVTQIMVPLLRYYFNEEVRGAAAQALPELLRSAVESMKKNQGATQAFCVNMAHYMWHPLVEAVAKEGDPDIVSTLLTSVEEVLSVAEGPALIPVEMLAPLFQTSFPTVLEDYEGRRKERMERASGEDFDAEEQEALEEEHEAEGELLDALGTACTTALRLYGDAVMPLIEGLMPAVGQLLEKGRFVEERRVALCLMDDLNIVSDGFRQHAGPAVTSILAIIQAPDARSEDNLSATENAVSALGKVLEFLPDCIDPGMGALYVQNLPIEEDEIEAKVVHAQLLRLLRASDPRILGENNAHLPKLVEVIVRVLAKGKALIEDEDAAGMVMLLKQMQGALPAETFNGFIGALKPKQQSTLASLLDGKATLLLE